MGTRSKRQLHALIIWLLVFSLMAAGAARNAPDRSKPQHAVSQRPARISVSHIFDAHSPLRPAGCDDACATRLRLKRMADSREARRRTNGQRGELNSTPWGNVNTSYSYGGMASEYYTLLSIGSASQGVLMTLDTGSDISWVQCQPCEQCYVQTLPIFDPDLSSGYVRTNADDPYCRLVQSSSDGAGADDSSCLYLIEYADDSTTNGYIAKDEFNFWDADASGTSVSVEGVAFGCGIKNSVTAQTVASGLLGLGFGLGLSMPEQFASLGVYSTAFAFCLAPIFSSPFSGWLMFGDSALPPASFSSTPFLTDKGPGYFYVDLVDFLIGDQQVGLPAGTFDTNGVVVDAGNMLSAIATAAYGPFRAAWIDAVNDILGSPGEPSPNGLDTCWDYPNAVDLPSIALLFSNGNAFPLAAEATQLIFIDNNGIQRMCWPFLEEQDGDAFDMVIGGVTLHRNEVVFDTVNQVFAWNPGQC